MTATEFNASREILAQSDDELAADLGVTPEIVRAWSEGSLAIPQRNAQHMTWLSASAQREAALQESGLPDCTWLRDAKAKPIPDKSSDAAMKHFEEILHHMRTCDVCLAQERFLNERFGPMPSMPEPAWLRAYVWAKRIPPWARPAAAGAFILATIVIVRVIFSLPRLISMPGKIGAALFAVIAAAGAGAAGGFAYSLTRPTLKRLGTVGDYLTGIVCVLAYMGSLAVVAPVAFGESIVADRADIVIFFVVSIFFGLFIGHTWFRQKPTD